MRWIDGVEVDWQEQLWRYFSAARFVEAVDTRSFYFASANQFVDPFEGAVAVISDQYPSDPRYPDLDGIDKAFFALKRLTKISCWHRATYESDAMWRLYAEQSKGVAICSTPDRIRNAFTPFRLQPNHGAEQLWGGPVRYVDLTKIRMKESMLNRFFFKHRAFEWEREFRLAISLRSAEEFGVDVPDLGISVTVDLDALVDHIIVGPALSITEIDMVVEHATAAGFGSRIRKSSLLCRPRYH